ncbi:GyrI-like domain-containing protein [Marinoscillum sp. MHG1-6]|uniref:GyrI-like domain-containing protein n=1 Tax=Marinoscillum sp. MHG1-6 TaxID=2959627 RepID=UPI00215892E4|nr:GyrI-like domain-containing protein [Marinoscillum sp. MHG1-6]
MVEPQIKRIQAKRLIGMSLEMSFADNKTVELWRAFMPRKSEVSNAIDSDLFSIQIYDPDFFKTFNPKGKFRKWAAVEVSEVIMAPHGMQVFDLPSGEYAVFHYKGNPQEGASMFQYIFGVWLPKSGYELDDRPHFEVLGAKYKNNDPDSEEEIWIPVWAKVG